VSFEGFPFIVGWELTLACNLRCRHCDSSAGAPRARELSRAEALSLCEQFPELLVNEVIFTGGEPLLCPYWSDLAARLLELGIKTGVVTNGLPLAEETVAAMLRTGLTAAGVSLDGFESQHDRIRGVEGAFRRAVRGIELMVSRGIEVTVITSVTAVNLPQLGEICELVLSLGAAKWQIQPLFPLGRGRADESLRLTDGEFLEMGRLLWALRDPAAARGLRIHPADSCGYFSPFDYPEMQWSGCLAGRSSIGIMSDGRVKGCLSWPDSTVVGDLREKDLWSIWFQPEAFSHLREFSREQMGGACRDCDAALECGGGCEAMSLAAAGDWHADPYCYRRILASRSSGAPALPACP
jgi:radical SAM protein with 4Fe4S-binding SPASM domain